MTFGTDLALKKKKYIYIYISGLRFHLKVETQRRYLLDFSAQEPGSRCSTFRSAKGLNARKVAVEI